LVIILIAVVIILVVILAGVVKILVVTIIILIVIIILVKILICVIGEILRNGSTITLVVAVEIIVRWETLVVGTITTIVKVRCWVIVIVRV